jgi:hypothetical protein
MARTIARSRFQRAVARGARGDGCPNPPPGDLGEAWEESARSIYREGYRATRLQKKPLNTD